MNEREPMTRTRLEEKIKRCQKDLDDAIGRKAYTEAGPLQEEIEVLTKQRANLPTIQELNENVKAAEEVLAAAVCQSID